jgi:hypothetical protein
VEVNHYLSLAEREFNKFSSAPTSFNTVKRRNYFWTKANLARDVKQAFLCLKMVNILQKDAPFLTYTQNGEF